MTNELQIASAEMHEDLDHKKLVVHVQLRNPGNRTLHAYASVRALRYDEATKTLSVQLSDRGLREMGPSGTFQLPRFTSIDPHGETMLELSLPRTIARLKPGHNQISPVVEEFPAYQAEQLEVEVAYSGTPFYRDPRPKTGKTPRKMMIDWSEGYATHRTSVRDQPRPAGR